MANISARSANRIRPTRWAITATLAALAFVLAACGTNAAAGNGPSPSALGPGLRMGPVELVTADLQGLHRFYTEGVGLSTISSDEDDVVLGIEGAALFRLIATDSPDAAQDDFTQAGLYHSAFLFPDATELASSVLRTATLAPDLFQGSSDHKVSHAFYFSDPEGNGVELYADTPENTWEWNDGLVTMGSAALDPNAYIATHLGNRTPDALAKNVSMDTSTCAAATCSKPRTSTETAWDSPRLPARRAPSSWRPMATTTIWPSTPGPRREPANAPIPLAAHRRHPRGRRRPTGCHRRPFDCTAVPARTRPRHPEDPGSVGHRDHGARRKLTPRTATERRGPTREDSEHRERAPGSQSVSKPGVESPAGPGCRRPGRPFSIWPETSRPPRQHSMFTARPCING